MKIRLIAVGDRPRAWVTAGFDDYARRLPRENQLLLVEVPAGPGKTPPGRLRVGQGQRLIRQLRPSDWVVALDGRGEACSTHGFARKLDHWRTLGRDVAMLVGGAVGLDEACLDRADEVMSLSRLTFPHELVRVVVAEQVYRAWTLLAGHPYHRS